MDGGAKHSRAERKHRKSSRRPKAVSAPPLRPSQVPQPEKAPRAALTRRDDFESSVAALFQDRKREPSGESLYWSLAIGVATVLAYAAWLLLLDYL